MPGSAPIDGPTAFPYGETNTVVEESVDKQGQRD